MTESERWSTRFGIFAGLTLGMWFSASWAVVFPAWTLFPLGSLLVLPGSYCAWRAVRARDVAQDPEIPAAHVTRLMQQLAQMGLSLEDTLLYTDDEILSWENVGPKTLKWIRWSASR